ncbi:hypothetical protein [Microbacterium lacticum]|uniref:hypothetical protein n=1 Tax=Microbacterium lacticum TaxID=33885 RepID=UPI0028D2BD3D|nr:hypothetical protein [Microbacterium lacticum]
MIALLLVAAGLGVLAADAADFSFCGLSILAVLLLALGLWVGGAFNRSVWVADAETSARLDALDRVLPRGHAPRTSDGSGR